MIVREATAIALAAVAIYWVFKDLTSESQCLYTQSDNGYERSVWQSCEEPPEWWSEDGASKEDNLV